MRIINEAAVLSDEELGAFMRREGLHEVDLKQLREMALVGLERKGIKRGPTPEQKRIKKLEQELRRKDRALAEAAALLVLQKKFQALLAEEGDDIDDKNGDDY